MSELRRKHPYEFFTRGKTIRANVESIKRHAYEYTSDYPADSFVLPGAVQDWIDVEFEEEVCVVTITTPAALILRSLFATAPVDIVKCVLINV